MSPDTFMSSVYIDNKCVNHLKKGSTNLRIFNVSNTKEILLYPQHLIKRVCPYFFLISPAVVLRVFLFLIFSLSQNHLFWSSSCEFCLYSDKNNNAK